MDKISVLGEASGSSMLPKRRIWKEVSEEPLSPSCWTGCAPSASDRELSISQPFPVSDQEKLLMAWVDLSPDCHIQSWPAEETLKRQMISLSPHLLSLCLSLPPFMYLCHSTFSFRKSDRLTINKRKRICSPLSIIPPSPSSSLTPWLSQAWSLTLPYSILLYLSHSLNLLLLKTKSS